MEILVYIGIRTSQLIDLYRLVHYSDSCMGFAFAWVAIKRGMFQVCTVLTLILSLA